MGKKPVPPVYADLDRGEKIPNPGIGTVVKRQGLFLVITAEKWLLECPCVKPNCSGGTRAHQFKLWEP